MDVLLVLLLRDRRLLRLHRYVRIRHIVISKKWTHLGQPPADGTGALGAEVEGEVLLALVELAQILACLCVRDGQDTGDRLADAVAATLN